MQVTQKILDEINSTTFSLSSKNSIVGLDGFVDKIVAPVEKRHGLGDNFDPVPTIAEMGAKISAAAGKSANIELYPRFEKLGGNGPIMANAMLSQVWVFVTLVVWVTLTYILSLKNSLEKPTQFLSVSHELPLIWNSRTER